VLKPTLGSRYTQAWDETGFIGSLAVPATISGRTSLVKSLELYFTAHPSLEVASLGVTHQQAETLHEALSSAVSALNAAWSEQRDKKDARAPPPPRCRIA
jgi:hypothetical protein